MSWPLVKLGSVCQFINGDRGKNYPSKEDLFDEGIPFINAGNLTEDLAVVCSGANYISESRYNLLSNGKVQEKDILFCLRGSLGKLAIVDSSILKGAIASSLVIIRSNSRIDGDYLKNYLRSTLCAQEINRFENGAAQPNLSARDLGEFEIPLPPLEEQKRIAAILDKADAIRRKRQQAIKLADDFLRSVFLEMFGDPVTNPKGWEVKTLESLVKKTITYGVLKPEEFIEDGIPMLRIQDLKGGIIREDCSFHLISKSLSDQYRRTELEGGELVISLVGTVGLVARVPSSLAGANVHRNLGVISLKSVELNEYLCSLMQLPHFKIILDKISKGGVHALLNLADLKEVEIMLPDMALVFKFTEIKKLTQKMLLSFDLFSDRELFSSLSQRAFQGNL